MSAIFLSHSSADNEAAAEIRAWLRKQGHDSVFLDFDPEHGIPAGRSWERELYRQLRSCRAVLVLCSEHSMASRWCFAEITHGRSLGKQIFPLKIGPCTIDPVLTDRQVVDLTTDRDDGLARLAQGLLAAGIDPADPLDWDPKRSPYPGLLAFQEEDAAVFFGRDAEIGAGLDALQQARWQGGAPLVTILGASGSGKSSLLRAGMLPRLRRDPDRWRIVGPFRPGARPLAELASALAAAFAEIGDARDWRRILADLEAVPPGDAANPLLEWLEALRLGSDRREATTLIVIDQLEELLGYPRDHPASDFLIRLRAALDAAEGRVLVLATMRSDFLGTFQKSPQLEGLEMRGVPVGPLSVAALAQVIERPAALAGLDLESGLVQAILDDVETEDALPLLAFTLRRLYDGWSGDGILSVAEYRDELGGLQGAVAKAAEGVLGETRLSPAEEEDLRRAFLAMVRLNEAGQYARRPVSRDRLPPGALPHLQRFVDARLLVARGDGESSTLEVAHEALFRNWSTLARWLREDRETLLLHNELDLASRQWLANGRAEEYLWRQGRLLRAIELRDANRLQLAGEELDFLAASEAFAAEKERRRRRQRRRIMAAALAVAVVTSALAGWAVGQRHAAERQGSRVLAVQALTLTDRLDLALLLSLEASRVTDSFESRTSLLSLLSAEPRLETFLWRYREAVWAVAFSPDGTRVASGGDDGVVGISDVATREPLAELPVPGGDALRAVAFSPDGQILASGDHGGDHGGEVLLWSVAERRPVRTLTLPGPALSLAYDPARRLLASGGGDGVLRVWNDAEGELVLELDGHPGGVQALAFHPGGDLLASAGSDGAMRLWSLERGRLEAELGGYGGELLAIAFSPDGDTLAAAGDGGEIWLWGGRGDAPLARIAGPPTRVWSLAFRTPESLFAAGDDGAIRLWDLAAADADASAAGAGARVTVLGQHAASVRAIAVAPDGRTLASASVDRTVLLWDVTPRPFDFVLAEDGRLYAIVFAADGRRVVSGADNGSVKVWDPATGALERDLEGHRSEITALAISVAGGAVAAGGRSGEVGVWDVSSGALRWRLEEDPSWVWSVAFSPDGERLAVGRDDGKTTIRHAVTGAPLLELAGHASRVRALDFGPAGRRLATGSGDRTARLWDADTGKLLAEQTGFAVGVMSIAFAPAGDFLAVGTADGAIRLCDATTLEIFALLDGHETEIRALTFGPGGVLASASADETLRMWSVSRAGGEPLFRLVGHQGPVHGVAFAGEALVSGSADQTVRRWLIDPEGAAERVCRRANRNLTRDEWSDYLGTHRKYRPTCSDLPSSPADGDPAVR